MALVDFSNAVIEIYNSKKPLKERYLGFTNYDSATTAYGLVQPDGTSMWLASTPRVTVLTNTPTKYSIAFTGTLTNFLSTPGTELLLEVKPRYSSSYDKFWRISNISFNNNDTYSFVIDIEITGS